MRPLWSPPAAVLRLGSGTHSLIPEECQGGCALCQPRAARLYTRGTLTTEYVVVGVGGVLNLALIA